MQINRINKKKLQPAKIDDERKEKIIHQISIGFLAAAGIIYSASFFGYFVVPNSDFLSFLHTGQQWLSFHIPGDMKRAPVFSLIAALAGLPFSRPDRYLFGAELYNALLLPVVMILIYLNCRNLKLAGAVWIALIAGISPWVVRMSSEPLAELTLVTFFAAAVLFVRKHIKLAYLFAALASITRWDMTGLIPAIALVDVLQNRQWKRTILYSLIALIPFLLCMIIIATQLKGQSGGLNYLQLLDREGTFKLKQIAADLQSYWRGIMSFLDAQLLHKKPTGGKEVFKAMNTLIFRVTAPLLAAAFLTGAVFAVIRKQWEIIVMLITAVPYVLIHAVYPYRMPRFCVPVQWVGLVVAVYGAEIVWRKIFSGDKRKLLFTVLSIAAAAVCISWAVIIGDSFSNVRRNTCPDIGMATFLASIIALGSFLVMEVIRKPSPSGKWLLIPAFLILTTISSGTNIGAAMGNGKSDENFKKLAEWFLNNAKENDKMMTTMPGFMPIFTGLPEERFVHTGSIPAEDANDFSQFIEKCTEEGVTLIAWDSRVPPKDRYYKLWGLERIQVLSEGITAKKVTAIGQCRLIYLITEGKIKIAIYRIIKQSNDQ